MGIPWPTTARAWLPWLDPFNLTRRERLVAATTLAAGIVFLGLMLDVPSGKRLRAMEAERAALEGEIGLLQREVASLTPARREQDAGPPDAESPTVTDPRFSALMRYLTAMAALTNIDVMAVRPASGADASTTLTVELNADLRMLSHYLGELERSHWGLTINDVHLVRNPERTPSISARFSIATSMVTPGLAVEQSGRSER